MKRWWSYLQNKITVWIIVILLPVYACLFVIYHFYIQQNVEREKSKAEHMLAMQLSETDNLFSGAEAIVQNYYDDELSKNHSTVEQESFAQYLFFRDLKQTLDFYSYAQHNSANFFIYCKPADYFVIDSNAGVFSSYLEQFKADVLCSADMQPQTWSCFTANGKSYFYYLTDTTDFLTGAVISVEHILDKLSSPAIDGSRYYITDRNRELLNQKSSVLPSLSSMDKHTIVSESASSFGYHILNYANYQSGWKLLSETQLFLLLLSIITILAVPTLRAIIKLYVLNPVKHLKIGLEYVADGDLSYRLSEKNNTIEFSYLNHEFNVMTRNIHDLKVESYEHALKKKEQEIYWLQHQIRPHFIMNNLNMIRNLASMHKYQEVQELTLYLSNYLRNAMRKNFSVVSWAEEIAFTKDYARLLEFGYPNQIRIEISETEEIQDSLVPPLILSTFLENAVKYAFQEQKILTVWIKGEKITLGDEVFLQITILDNGPGYTGEIISMVNQVDTEHILFDEHIGLMNLKARLLLLYGTKATLLLRNDTDNGAFACIQIPWGIVNERIDR